MRHTHDGLRRGLTQRGVLGGEDSRFYSPAEQMFGREQFTCLCLRSLLAHNLKIFISKGRMQFVIRQKGHTFYKIWCENLQGERTPRTLPCRNVVQSLLEGQTVILRGAVREQCFGHIIHPILPGGLLERGGLPDLTIDLNGVANMGGPDNQLDPVGQGADIWLRGRLGLVQFEQCFFGPFRQFDWLVGGRSKGFRSPEPLARYGIA